MSNKNAEELSDGRRRSKPRLLLVEDDIVLANKLTEVLRVGFKVGVCQDALEALGVLKHQEFEVVLSDFGLPYFSGVELLRWVQEHRPTAVRVLMSAQPAPGANAVAQLVVGKPCPKDLRERLEALLSGSS